MMNNLNDPSKLWEILKEVTNYSTTKTSPNLLIVDEVQHTDPQEISEIFNNYFKNVIDDLKRSMQDPTINYHVLKEFVNQRLENNTKFEIPPISERKVFEYMKY